MNLLEVFEGLNRERIDELIERRQIEHLQLEFKTVSDVGFSRHDRINLASCISGFANSSGGIIIWGVVARPNAENIDGASSPSPITPLNRFFSRLNEFTSIATSPPVDGIQHKMIEIVRDQGFAATIVPESVSGPHMAKLGEDRYYKRNGTQFYVLEHFDLEDMFGRRQRPNLKVIASSKRIADNPQNEELEVKILNVGKAVARHVGLFAELRASTIVSVSNFQNVSEMNPGRQIFTYSNDQNVIHPNNIQNVIGTATDLAGLRCIGLTMQALVAMYNQPPRSTLK
jgi:hypothetical protein